MRCVRTTREHSPRTTPIREPFHVETGSENVIDSHYGILRFFTLDDLDAPGKRPRPNVYR